MRHHYVLVRSLVSHFLRLCTVYTIPNHAPKYKPNRSSAMPSFAVNTGTRRACPARATVQHGRDGVHAFARCTAGCAGHGLRRLLSHCKRPHVSASGAGVVFAFVVCSCHCCSMVSINTIIRTMKLYQLMFEFSWLLVSFNVAPQEPVPKTCYK